MRFQLNKSPFILFISGMLFSCGHVAEEDASASDKQIERYELKIPDGFPAMNIPDDNYLSFSRIELGERLFFDVLLSKDSSISCSSCHKPEFAFADSVRISPGIDGKSGFRNAPALINIGYHQSFMLDGGVPTLEIQVVHPLTDTNEMGFGINEVVNRLKKHPYYSSQSKKAYSRELDAFVITRALSAYERTLVKESKYDQYISGNKKVLTESELNGMRLFFSDELNCSSCHNGVFFTDFSFQNNGSKEEYTGDNGRERITHKPEDIGKFKVPSLRNVGITAPYMHDGSFSSLEKVIDHYSLGGFKHPNKSSEIRGFNLSYKEKADLIQFLKCL